VTRVRVMVERVRRDSPLGKRSDLMEGSHYAGVGNNSVPLFVRGDPCLGLDLGLKVEHRLMNAIRADYVDVISSAVRAGGEGVGCRHADVIAWRSNRHLTNS
jgi:hypothetical protein